MKRCICLLLAIAMILSCGGKYVVAEEKSTQKKQILQNYVVSAKSNNKFQDIRKCLEKKDKIISRHIASDDNFLECNQSITAKMTQEEANDLNTGDVFIEKDFPVYACENKNIFIPEENVIEPSTLLLKNEFADGEKNIECQSVEVQDFCGTEEYTENPEKFKPCKAIKRKTKNEVIPWNIACVAGTPHKNKYKGKGIKVAIIDSGIDTHDELNTKEWVDFSDKVKGYKPIDNSGHGTQVAGVIASRINGIGMQGIAEDAEIYSVKILDSENQASISAVIKAIEWCIQNDINIINMSFGADENSKILHEVIKKAEKNNIVMVASAGNKNNKMQYPAKYPEVIAVGSIDEKLVGSEFSDNKNVDLVAPGENVQTLGYLGSYTKTKGTSIAAAHVTGVAAAVMSAKKTIKNTELRNLLKESAICLKDGSRLVNYRNAIDKMKALDISVWTEEHVKTLAEDNFSEDSFVEGSWNSDNWGGMDGTGHYSMINKMALSCFGKDNESETEKTYRRWIVARASYLTDNLEWLSGSHMLGKANRNEAGEIVLDGTEFKPPYHASSTYSINEVVGSHLQFLYELARRRLILGSNLDLNATNYSGNTYYKVSISQKMKRRIIVDMRAVHEHLTVYFQNHPIDMNSIQNKGYMVLGVFLHLVEDIQAHRAQVTFNMIFNTTDGMVFYGYDSFGASANISRLNGMNIKDMPNKYDTYWELYSLLKQGPIPMIRLQSRLKERFTIEYNGKKYNCTAASAYEDNPYFYSDRFETANHFSWAYIIRMQGDTGHYSTQTSKYYADGRVPLC